MSVTWIFDIPVPAIYSDTYSIVITIFNKTRLWAQCCCWCQSNCSSTYFTVVWKCRERQCSCTALNATQHRRNFWRDSLATYRTRVPDSGASSTCLGDGSTVEDCSYRYTLMTFLFISLGNWFLLHLHLSHSVVCFSVIAGTMHVLGRAYKIMWTRNNFCLTNTVMLTSWRWQ